MMSMEASSAPLRVNLSGIFVRDHLLDISPQHAPD
jgi:hypothetical protein